MARIGLDCYDSLSQFWAGKAGEGLGVNWFCLKACTKCGGDLAVDDGDWICMQCGTYYYTGLYRDLYRGNWAPSPSQPTLGSGDTGRRGDVRWPQKIGPLRKSAQEAAHLLGAS